MTCATVQSAFTDHVFTDSDIKAYTTAIYPYEQTLGSEFETAKLYFEQEINFISYQVSFLKAFGVTGEVVTDYSVSVTYTRAQDTTGAAFTSIRDFFEKLFSTIDTNLGGTWGSTVDYWLPPDAALEIGDITIESQPCWTATATYRGIVSA